MGAVPSNETHKTFLQLSQEHMMYFIAYVLAVKSKSLQDEKVYKNLLLQNVEECKAEVNSRVPGSSFFIKNRFVHSMDQELLLLKEPLEAAIELRSCHQSVIQMLVKLGTNETEEKWEVLWTQQLKTMIDYIIEPSQSKQNACLESARLLGQQIDAMNLKSLTQLLRLFS